MLETLKGSSLSKCSSYFYSEDKDIVFSGLCILTAGLFTGKELGEVKCYLDMNKPYDIDGPFWFTRVAVDCYKAKQERIEFLEKLINEL